VIRSRLYALFVDQTCIQEMEAQEGVIAGVLFGTGNEVVVFNEMSLKCGRYVVAQNAA